MEELMLRLSIEKVEDSQKMQIVMVLSCGMEGIGLLGARM